MARGHRFLIWQVGGEAEDEPILAVTILGHVWVPDAEGKGKGASSARAPPFKSPASTTPPTLPCGTSTTPCGGNAVTECRDGMSLQVHVEFLVRSERGAAGAKHVQRRYRDFEKLHEALTKHHSLGLLDRLIDSSRQV